MKIKKMMIAFFAVAVSVVSNAGGINVDRPWELRAPKTAVREFVKGVYWVEAENFDDYGGWLLDTQFAHKMGSGYLIAPGVGKASAVAVTKLEAGGVFMAAKKEKNEVLMYKDRPLVRRGNVLYYGYVDDAFIVKITEDETEKVGEVEMGTKVTVQLTTNNTQLNDKERIIRQSKKTGLYDALDIGVVWLEEVLDYQEA